MRGFNREFNRARNVTRLDIDHCFASLRLRRFSFHVEIGNLCIRKRLLEVNLPVHDFGKKDRWNLSIFEITRHQTRQVMELIMALTRK